MLDFWGERTPFITSMPPPWGKKLLSTSRVKKYPNYPHPKVLNDLIIFKLGPSIAYPQGYPHQK